MNQLQEVESKLEEIVAVRWHYSGRVRRVKILGQNDRLITADALRAIVEAISKLNQPEKAAELLQDALAFIDQIPDSRYQANALFLPFH